MIEEERFDLLIIGGGPAGQAAALTLSGHGLRIGVLDEQPRPGGQILRQPPPEIRIENWLPDRSYDPLKQQLADFESRDDIEWLGGHSVVGLQPPSLLAEGPDGLRQLVAPTILIATGAQDLAVPLPGWTRPGVYSAGAIQAFIKSQQLLAGERIMLVGTHPLQLVIARQIVTAGGRVAGVFFAQPREQMRRMLLRHPLTAFSRFSDLLTARKAERELKQAGVPLHYGVGLHALEANDSDHLGAALTSKGRVECDAAGLCFGFVPQSELPRMAGAAMRPAGPAGGWAVIHDDWMRTNVRGLYAAGETVGVAGAEAAAAGGALAGLGIARDLGLIAPAKAEQAAQKARNTLSRHRAFAAMLDTIADPRPYFPAMEGDTVVCRCEDIDRQTIDAALTGCGSANSLKLLTRCGMGACQGRVCEPTLLRLLEAAGKRDDSGFTARFPARPLPLATLAADDSPLR